MGNADLIVQLFAAKGYECRPINWKPATGASMFKIGSFALLESDQGWEIQRGLETFGTFQLGVAEIVDKTIEIMNSE